MCVRHLTALPSRLRPLRRHSGGGHLRRHCQEGPAGRSGNRRAVPKPQPAAGSRVRRRRLHSRQQGAAEAAGAGCSSGPVPRSGERRGDGRSVTPAQLWNVADQPASHGVGHRSRWRHRSTGRCVHLPRATSASDCLHPHHRPHPHLAVPPSYHADTVLGPVYSYHASCRSSGAHFSTSSRSPPHTVLGPVYSYHADTRYEKAKLTHQASQWWRPWHVSE
jgi:hypothetical protein